MAESQYRPKLAAVVGLLAIGAAVTLLIPHGFDLKVVQPEAADTHPDHGGISTHRALGLCLFGVLGSIAIATRVLRPGYDIAVPAWARLTGEPTVLAPPGRMRRTELCVYRL